MSRLAAALSLALCFGASSHAAEPRRIYVQETKSEQPDLYQLLEELDSALADGEHERAALFLDRALERAAQPSAGNRLVASGEGLYRGLRTHLVLLGERLPPQAKAELARIQEEGGRRALRSQQPPSQAGLLARFPFAPVGGLAARRLWERAVESGDPAGSRYLAELLRLIHPKLAPGPEPAKLEEALSRAESAARAEATSTPASTAKLLEVSVRRLAKEEPLPDRVNYSPAYPTWINGRVCVSTGSRIAIFTPGGDPVGSIPLSENAAAQAPPPALTGFQAFIATRDGIGFTPLVLERWMAPGRAGLLEKDPSFAGRVYSLVAFDPARAKLLWWDGDAGPRSGLAPGIGTTPPGWSGASPNLLGDLARGHVLACAADARYVYSAIITQGEGDPALSVLAFHREATGRQVLALRPAWARPTHLFSAERRQGSAEDAPVLPEIATVLSLDGAGRLFVSTDLGVVAALSTGSGDLLWLRQAKRSTPRANLFQGRPGNTIRAPVQPPEPVRFTLHPELGPLAVFFSGGELVASRAWNGEPVWTEKRRGTSRLLTGPSGILAYGGRVLQAFDAAGKPRIRPTSNRLSVRVTGRAARVGSSLVLPVTGLASASTHFIHRYELPREADPRLVPTGTWAVKGVTEPLNLLAVPGGLVAATRDRVLFFRWSE